MDSPPASPKPASSRTLLAIVVGGLACGVGDLIFAVVHYHAPLNGILRSVARGVLSREISHGNAGWPPWLGLALHFTISLGAASVFVGASRKLAILTRAGGVPGGLVYGVVVYFVMNWVIVPLSAITVAKYPPAVDWIALVGHMFVVGLPISLAARWIAPTVPRK